MKRHYTKAEKTKILSEFSRSGLGVSAFSRKRGIALSTLSKWKREQRGEQEAFIELSPQGSYELKVGEVTLKVPATVSARQISDLIKALGC